MNSAVRARTQVVCAVCGGTRHAPLRRLNGYSIVRCAACGFAFVNPRPTEEEILKAYTGESSESGISFASAYASEAPVEIYGSWSGGWVLRRLLRSAPGATVLDIGAGHGWVVAEALRLGADAHGYEFGDSRAFDQDPELKRRIFKTENEIEKSGIRFDRLHLSAVLEHVYDPVSFLRRWMRFLKPGGIFCVAAVPNLDSIFIRLGWDGWDGNIPPHHLNYFTPKTLERCVRAAGGETIETFSMGLPQSIDPRNVFRQKNFDGPVWGDRADKWAFTQKPASCRSSPSWAVAGVNHFFRAFGGGANLYIFFRRSGERPAA